MTYTLSQVLEDKNLRRTLANGVFTFEDGNRVFALDFQEQSMFKNHRETFDRLCELGGEELLSKLLEGGKTCLVAETDAAKQGISRIRGTDSFFLKTNAGAPTALASILFGIAGWAEMSDDFDAGAVYCRLIAEEDAEEPEVAEKEHNDPDKLEEGEFDLNAFKLDTENAYGWKYDGNWIGDARVRPHNGSRVVKNGKTVIYDDDEKCFVTFFAESPRLMDRETLQVEEMLICEPLCSDDVVLGYRYKLEENGKWGFLSRHFAQCIAPVFDELMVAETDMGNAVLAIGNDEWGSNTQLYCSGQADYYSPETAKDGWLREPDWSEHLLHAGLWEIGLKFIVSEEYLPTERARISVDVDSTVKSKAVLYTPDSTKTRGYFFRQSEYDDEGHYEYYTVNWENGFLRFAIPFNDDWEVCRPAAEYPRCANHCAVDLDGGAPKGFEAKEWLSEDIYIVYKEGYYAVAQLKFGYTPEIKRLLTPFAFTGMMGTGKSFVWLYLFGKKGVYDWEREDYVIPCDYESILYLGDYFLVSRMGFRGRIGANGQWIEHLHREEP